MKDKIGKRLHLPVNDVVSIAIFKVVNDLDRSDNNLTGTIPRSSTCMLQDCLGLTLFLEQTGLYGALVGAWITSDAFVSIPER